MTRSATGMAPSSNGKRGRVFCWFERGVLGVGMTLMAFVVERRLLKAIKRGSVEPAPRTAGAESGQSDASSPAGELSTAARQVGD
jgi:hypothetical protein